MIEEPVRLIAFYLPQYHPTPENDLWWGKGFTEWTSVAQARPLFPSHYQPQIPADLGFYDLRLPEARQAQADLAREYGIYGFCYYHYWMGGKRLLEYPFDRVLASGEPDFPFCLCWANEPWTRAWDGRSSDVLMAQEYSEEDDLNHIRWLAAALADRRYIRIGGKPLLLIYRANQLPNPLRTTTVWREEARRLGIGEIYLGRVESFPDEFCDPREIGMDAAIEFQPDGANLNPKLDDLIYRDHEVYDYDAFMQKQLRKPDPPYRRYSCVMPGWDNTPRRPMGARIFTGSSPPLYEQWLRAAIRKTRSSSLDDKFVFVNAWNEWGESNHLEPDMVFGRQYLEATRRALSGATGDEPQPELLPGQHGEDGSGSGLLKSHAEGLGGQENGNLQHKVQALERMVGALQNTVREQQALIDSQQATVNAYVELERWAHELEITASQQQATIRTYQVLLRPFSPLVRLVRALRHGAETEGQAPGRSGGEEPPAVRSHPQPD